MDTDSVVKNNFNVHDHFKDLTVDELRIENMKSRLPFAVCAWNIDGNLNIGMMIRTACNLGAERFVVIGRRHYDKRSCVGSNHYYPITVVNGYDVNADVYDPVPFWNTMAEYGYTPVFLETWGESLSGSNFDISSFASTGLKPCLVFGSEGKGLPPDVVNDPRARVFSIPQAGVIRSFNVSAAAAIAMWELVRPK